MLFHGWSGERGKAKGKKAVNICIIPARGGSKRIPRKNIKPFHGVPMIARSIGAALASGCFDQVIVSTEDPEIADIARDAGASVPFMRPDDLADDHTGTVDVIQHGIRWLDDQGSRPDAVCCLYAAAPFVRAGHLSAGQQLLENASFVVPVLAYPHPIQRALKISDGTLDMVDPDNRSVRTQDLDPCYHDAGQFYWGKTEAWLDGTPILGPKSAPLILPREQFEDIDTPEDWARAELMYRLMNEA